jgi:hypothetical protein
MSPAQHVIQDEPPTNWATAAKIHKSQAREGPEGCQMQDTTSPHISQMCASKQARQQDKHTHLGEAGSEWKWLFDAMHFWGPKYSLARAANMRL